MAVETRKSDARIGFPDPKNPRNTFFPDLIGPGKGRGRETFCPISSQNGRMARVHGLLRANPLPKWVTEIVTAMG